MSPFGRRAVYSSVVVCLMATACGGGRELAQGSDPFTGPGNQVTLTVHNRDFAGAKVYAIWVGVRRRVGTVSPMMSETFTFRWRDEEIRLGIEFIGNTYGYSTQPIPVTQGDHLEYMIEPQGLTDPNAPGANFPGS